MNGLDFNHDAIMEEPVQQGSGSHVVTEDLTPVGPSASPPAPDQANTKRRRYLSY